MNRREFAGHLATGGLAVAVLGGGLSLEGCSVWTEIEQWVPVGIAAFESVVVLVAPLAAPGINALAETVKAGFASLAAAVDSYISAPAAQKATFLAKVQLIFEDISQNLQAFLNAVNVGTSNPIIKIVLGLVNIILSTIAGFVNRITPASSIKTTSLKMGGQVIVVTPKLRNKNQFKKDFNAECIADGHPEAQIQ